MLELPEEAYRERSGWRGRHHKSATATATATVIMFKQHTYVNAAAMCSRSLSYS